MTRSDEQLAQKLRVDSRGPPCDSRGMGPTPRPQLELGQNFIGVARATTIVEEGLSDVFCFFRVVLGYLYFSLLYRVGIHVCPKVSPGVEPMPVGKAM